MTEVRFEAIIGLKPWSWADDPEVSLDWGFRFASGSNGGLDFFYDSDPCPSGTLIVRLPRRLS